MADCPNRNFIIYKVTNLVNGKIYIGQTANSLEWRKAKHIEESKRREYAINYAIRKYGAENFLFETFCQCLSKAEMDLKEKEIIKMMNSKAPFGYNLTDGGEGSSGFKHSDESRAKMSLSHKGISLSDEHKKKISLSGRGLKRSLETRMKISVAKKKQVPSFLGRKHTEETKKKMRMAHLGKKMSEEVCRHNGDLKRGKTLSAEHKAKISISLIKHNMAMHNSLGGI